jgi:short subunit fatty acids transporter
MIGTGRYDLIEPVYMISALHSFQTGQQLFGYCMWQNVNTKLCGIVFIFWLDGTRIYSFVD